MSFSSDKMRTKWMVLDGSAVDGWMDGWALRALLGVCLGQCVGSFISLTPLNDAGLR